MRHAGATNKIRQMINSDARRMREMKVIQYEKNMNYRPCCCCMFFFFIYVRKMHLRIPGMVMLG